MRRAREQRLDHGRRAEEVIANIGPRERARRLRMGTAVFGATVAVAALLVATGAPRSWRVALFAPSLVAALGFFQARDKT
jgi:hypothetical protein